MKFFGKEPKQPIDFAAIDPPWDSSRESIYGYVKRHLAEGQGALARDHDKLPDDETIFKEGDIRWVAGGMDGAFGHHSSGKNDPSVKKLFRALKDVLKLRDSKSVSTLYGLLCDDSTLSFVDGLIEEIANADLVTDASLYALAKWLLKNAPDREPVKTAIALLGVCGTKDDLELFLDIGKHEEFTLYTCVAIVHSADNPEEALWEIAKAVHGWGRIQAIDRLAETDNPDIKMWLLREGYKNDVMHEYVAYICATTGDLHGALSTDHPDDEVIKGACMILRSMQTPGTSIDEYECAPKTALLLFKHLENREMSPTELHTIDFMRTLLQDMPLDKQEQLGWSEVSKNLLEISAKILARPTWSSKIEEGLKSSDRMEFWNASAAAQYLNIDTWDIHYEKVRMGESNWYTLMQTKDESRIRKAVALAETTFPLDIVASGVSDSRGLGPDFALHNDFGMVLQELRHWPRIGYGLIMAGLKSPVVRNRNMSLMALKTWDRNCWEADTEDALRNLLEIEPNERTKDLIREILGEE